MNTAGIIGHEAVLRMLAAETAHPAHAYMFTGPASVGKGTIARRFAAAVICGEDAECTRRAVEGLHPDLVAIEPEGSSALTVDQARQAVARSNLTPVEAAVKVFLFEDAGMMNDQAANALLKTLEEPSPSTIFILVTESEDDLPDTVASRCRTVRFGRVDEGEIVAALMGLGAAEETAIDQARISGGRPGLAIMLGSHAEFSRYRRAWLEVPSRLTGSPGEAFRLAGAVVAAAEPLIDSVIATVGDVGKEARDRAHRRIAGALHVSGLEMLASWYRDAAAAQYGAPVRNKDVPPAQFTSVRPENAVARAHRVLATIETLESHQRPELAFAALFADLGAGN